jgi:putative Mn2+ efflux pump MntP
VPTLEIFKIIAFVLPLGLDTFAMGTALGLSGVAGRDRTRVSLVFTLFEAVMPLVGFVLGAAVGAVIGRLSTILAAGALATLAIWMLWPRDEDHERERVRMVERTQGPAVLGLGLGISLDELGIGFGIGLVRAPLLLLLVLIAAQAFVAAQLGMRLGRRLGEEAGEWAERLAGVMLLVAAALVLVT